MYYFPYKSQNQFFLWESQKQELLNHLQNPTLAAPMLLA